MITRKLSDATIECRQEYSRGTRVFNFLLVSDIHFDNPHCNRKKYFKDLDRAREIGARVMCIGDFFCLMQGKYDPRRSKSGIRPEHNQHNYLDLVINEAAELHKDYADLFICFTLGNHETAITRNCETDPLERFVERLNFMSKTNIQKGKYQGFLRFVFQEKKSCVRTVNLFYHHGKFGGVVSKGTQGVGRYGLIAPDADVLVSGHTHDRWFVEQPRFRLKQNGVVCVEPQYHIKMGTYKEEFEGMEGWAVERIVMPKSIGGMWLTIDLRNKHREPRIKISTEL